jgi:hypothetical protein
MCRSSVSGGTRRKSPAGKGPRSREEPQAAPEGDAVGAGSGRCLDAPSNLRTAHGPGRRPGLHEALELGNPPEAAPRVIEASR